LGNYGFQSRHLVLQQRDIFWQDDSFFGLVHGNYHLPLQYSVTFKICDPVDIFSNKFGIFRLEECVGSLGTSSILWLEIMDFSGTPLSGYVG
jgi:hypothetical protein